MPTNPTPWSPDEAAVERIEARLRKEEGFPCILDEYLRRHLMIQDATKRISRAVISESPLARAVELLEAHLQPCIYGEEDARCQMGRPDGSWGPCTSETEDPCIYCAARAFLRDLGKEGSRE